eukprot:scaffold266_cov76-Skeletonema_menzelii.AAC.1
MQARGFILDSRFWGLGLQHCAWWEVQVARCKVQVDFVLQELRCQEQHTSGGKAKLNCLSFKVQGSKGARFNLKS